MDIFRVIRSSLFDPAFYARMRTQPLTQAIRTFAILGLAGFGIIMVFAYVAVVPIAHSGLPDAVAAAYPSDLIVTVARVELSINQPQPYYIKNTLPFFSGKDAPENLVIFDGTDQLSGDLKANSTFAIIRKDGAITQGNNGQDQYMSFSAYQSTTTIDQSKFVGLVDQVKPYFAPAIIFGCALLFLFIAVIAGMLWVVFHGIYVLIPALIIFLVAMLQKKTLKYSEAYMIGLYASIPPAILFFLFSLLRLSVPVPFTYTITLLLIAFINLSYAPPLPTIPIATEAPKA